MKKHLSCTLPTAITFSLLLSACAVGPDFKSPDAPTTTSYTPTVAPTQTVATEGKSGIAQNFVSGQEIQAQWWKVFGSDPLNQLIDAALKQSPTMLAAQAALRQAQENFTAQTDNLYYPTITAQLAATRQRAAAGNSNLPAGNVFNLYNTSVNISYSLDLFGGSRRAVEGLESAVDYQRYQLEATYLTLTSNLVTTAIKEALLRAQLNATQEILTAQQTQLTAIEKQFTLGAITQSALLTQRSLTAQTAATIPSIQKSLAQTRHQLSIYAGKLPSESGLPEFTLDSLTLPADLPLSLPSALVQQRPDIRASEALLHEASAQIGVTTANQYPQITLNGAYGSSSMGIANFLSTPTTFWSLGAGILQPIFNGGSLSAKRRAAAAAYEIAAAQYQSTVLGAFQNVADVLRALEFDAQTLKARTDADTAASASLNLATKQHQLGAISYLTLLDAQRTYHETHITLLQAQAARYADTAALFQALGGGWWNRQQATP